VLLRSRRTWWPWRKFTPSVYYNDVGGFWHVWFADESHTTADTLYDIVDVYLSEKSGRIVGLRIYDQDLEQLAERKGRL
jgi:hypothetical protein